MIESTIFIGAVVIALTDAIKDLSPRVAGFITIIVAALLGGLIGLIDTQIGVIDISIAQGVLTGLAAAGTVSTAKRIG